MKSKVHQSQLWKCPGIVLNILLNPTRQEVDTVFWNAPVFYHTIKNKITSYCVLVKREKFQHVMCVFTYACHRKKGFAKKLITNVLKKHPVPTYLYCRSELEPFYRKIGFRRTKKAPLYLKKRVARINLLARPLLGRTNIIMKYVGA